METFFTIVGVLGLAVVLFTFGYLLDRLLEDRRTAERSISGAVQEASWQIHRQTSEAFGQMLEAARHQAREDES